ncbi:SUF system NifU family Fe-S cluster assembly protein [Spiroplasma poulsonii]|uniref:SUF system NifU family Fe-S cluster assembly protein n=1 Tax=Spiroplasma poulsonii TaxID=2138 RepID=A0A433ER09_9MOLU|nr:SUF system NifU family Fe-S cluster assembly protein [Spiroplasma poulsonii]MBW3057712.1 SUF system NifU family Fe-S cluster assembly protein [Spiroplasma poulsonii]RUP76981.1 SUF system NifU family Fe-S cluster assembly protein [Spiroplasma poulsonii]
MEFDKNDPMFLRQIIMEHYSEPQYKGLTKEASAHSIHQASESCIDDIHLELIVADQKIMMARFDGVGCAISTASTDIMAQELEGKTIRDGLAIIDNYFAMVFDKPYDETKLNELVAFINIAKQPNRIKCATIGVTGFQTLLLNLLDPSNKK